MTSWYRRDLDIYRSGLSSFLVQNEFQRFPCPHCGSMLVGRLTHVWFDRPYPKDDEVDYHYNAGAAEDSVLSLPLFYTKSDASEGVFAAGEILARVDRETLPNDLKRRWPILPAGDARKYGTVEGIKVDTS